MIKEETFTEKERKDLNTTYFSEQDSAGKRV